MTELTVDPRPRCIFDPTQTKICPGNCKLNWMIEYAKSMGSKFDPNIEPDITLLLECELETKNAN
jgi:hypothetical protein